MSQQQETKQELVRLPNVLSESIGQSSKRDRRIGKYHYSDLAGMGVEACARLYAGIDKEEDFSAYLSRRGLVLEQMGLAALPEHQRQPEVTYPHPELDLMVVLHPDGFTLDDDGNPVLLECASQLSAEDELKEDAKLDQVVTAAGVVNMGGVLTTRHGDPVPGEVCEVRIQLLGLWEGAEIPYTDIHAMAKERAQWLLQKAARVHALACAYRENEVAADAGEIAPGLEAAEQQARDWDERYPSQSRFQPEVAPILEGERGEEADRAVAAYAAWKDAEKEWKGKDGKGGHKARWKATLDLDTLKKIKAPSGGTITLRARKVQDVDPDVYAKLEGPSLEEQLEEAVAQMDKDLRPLQEKLLEAQRAHPANEQIQRLNVEIEKAREAATVTRQVPNGILVTRPKGKKEVTA